MNLRKNQKSTNWHQNASNCINFSKNHGAHPRFPPFWGKMDGWTGKEVGRGKEGRGRDEGREEWEAMGGGFGISL
jgi:hypothetical protein